jgi:hypothetical protein
MVCAVEGRPERKPDGVVVGRSHPRAKREPAVSSKNPPGQAAARRVLRPELAGPPPDGFERVRLHADLTILANLLCALARVRAISLAT